MKVAIIGGGVMGEAILGAAIDRQVLEPEDVVVCDVLERRRNQLYTEYGVRVTASDAEAMADADVVVLSVKPQDLRSVRGSLKADALLISIMAGVRIKTLNDEFGHERIVRVMPNTPVAAKAGMSVWTATEAVAEEQTDLVRRLLSAIGREIFVDDEKKVDMATAVSGSGPAYAFLVAEAMIEAAVTIGLPRAQAQEMVLQTMLGSALYALESGKSPAELRAGVTSPAGTTAAGLLELERGALRAMFVEAIQAAHERARELGEG